MKRVKRIFAIVLFIIVIAVIGYTVHTCSLTAKVWEERKAVEYEEN